MNQPDDAKAFLARSPNDIRRYLEDKPEYVDIIGDRINRKHQRAAQAVNREYEQALRAMKAERDRAAAGYNHLRLTI